MLRYLALPIAGLGLFLAAAACGGGGPAELPPSPSPASLSPSAEVTVPASTSQLPIKVVVSLPLFADFARLMGGENVEVEVLIPPGADPHTYEPDPEAIDLIGEADLIFVNGLGLETTELLDAIEANRKDVSMVLAFSRNVPSPTVDQSGRARPVYAAEVGDNPHLWLDVALARLYPETVADSLIIIDGVNQTFYDANFGAYRDELLALDDEIKTMLESIPPERRQLITFHDSFVHFARRYGLDILGFAAADPETAPDADALADLAEAAGDAQVPALFNEVGFDPAALADLGESVGVPVCSLYSDIQDEAATTYLEMMRLNVQELVRCLGQTEP